MKTRLIPFDIEKAKQGAKIITRNKKSVRILDYNLKSIDTPIVAAVMEDTFEHVFCYKITGKHECKDLYEYDLFIEEEVKTRRMTNQELSWWLQECPKKHREYSFKEGNNVYSNYFYSFDDTNEEVVECIQIRENGGKWQEPLIEE